MMVEPSAPPSDPITWFELTSLIDDLRAADYPIGAEEYILAQELILALIDRGLMPDDIGRMRTLLGPILCSTRSQQIEFEQHFERWAARVVASRRASALPDRSQAMDLRGEVHRLTVRAKGVGIAAAASLVVIGIFTSIIGTGAKEAPPSDPAPIHDVLKPGTHPPKREIDPIATGQVVGGILAGALLVLALYRGYLRKSSGDFLIRREALTPPTIDGLFVAGVAGELFRRPALFRLAQLLRKHRRVESDEVEVEASVQASIDKLGWFSPVFGTRPTQPEYLALVDRRSLEDHQAQFALGLLDRLKTEGLAIDRYEFDADPRLCFPMDLYGRPSSLDELAGRFPDHRLWIFSSSEGLVEPLSNRVPRWLDKLEAWKERYLFTPEPVDAWGWMQVSLAETGLKVLPATDRGLLAAEDPALASTLARGAASDDRADYPLELTRDVRRWLSPNPPDPEEVDACIEALRHYLGDLGFLWLCATAVYPDLKWELTLYLGLHLGSDGRQVVTETRLVKLSRLPWLRMGFMPDWLRERLIGEIGTKDRKLVRSALQQLLVTAIDGPVGGFELQVAREDAGTIDRIWRAISRHFRDKGQESGAFGDHVFHTWMNDHLAVAIPRVVGRMLRAFGRRGEPIRAPVVARNPVLAIFSSALIGVGLGLSSNSGLFPPAVNEACLVVYSTMIVLAHPKAVERRRLLRIAAELVSFTGALTVTVLVKDGAAFLASSAFVWSEVVGLGMAAVLILDRVRRASSSFALLVERAEVLVSTKMPDQAIAYGARRLLRAFDGRQRGPQTVWRANAVAIAIGLAVEAFVKGRPLVFPLVWGVYAALLTLRSFGQPLALRAGRIDVIISTVVVAGWTIVFKEDVDQERMFAVVLAAALGFGIARMTVALVNPTVGAPLLRLIDRLMPDRALEWLGDDRRTELEKLEQPPTPTPHWWESSFGAWTLALVLGILDSSEILGGHWWSSSAHTVLAGPWSLTLFLAATWSSASLHRSTRAVNGAVGLRRLLYVALDFIGIGAALWAGASLRNRPSVEQTSLFEYSSFWLAAVAVVVLEAIMLNGIAVRVALMRRLRDALVILNPARLYEPRPSDAAVPERNSAPRSCVGGILSTLLMVSVLWMIAPVFANIAPWLVATAAIPFAESSHRGPRSRLRILLHMAILWGSAVIGDDIQRNNSIHAEDLIVVPCSLAPVALVLFTLAGWFKQRKHPLARFFRLLELASDLLAIDRLFFHLRNARGAASAIPPSRESVLFKARAQLPRS